MKFETIKTDKKGSGNYLKIAPDTEVTGVLRGEVYKYFETWNGGKSTSHEHYVDGAQTKFSVNLIVYKEKEFKPYVWRFGITVNNLLAKIAEKTDITKTKINISRTGSTKDDTVYTVIPIGAVTDAVSKQLDKVPLHMLGAAPARALPEPSFDDASFGDPPEFDSDASADELPF